MLPISGGLLLIHRRGTAIAYRMEQRILYICGREENAAVVKKRTQSLLVKVESVPLGTTWSPTVPLLNFPDRIAKILPSLVLM